MELATLDAQGEPVELRDGDLFATTTGGAPTWAQWETAPGVCRLTAVREAPCFVGALWEVPGFGRVALTADAGGRGWDPGRPAEGTAPPLLPLELARTHLRRAQARAARLQERGEPVAAEDRARLDRAARALAQAAGASTPAAQARAAHAALAEALWAGEGLVLDAARRAIAALDPERRARLRLGCQGFGLVRSARHRELFFALFDAATLPFYRASLEPQEGQLDWAPRDRLLDLVAAAPRRVIPKGHPLVWVHQAGTPAWMAALPYERLREVVRRQVRETVARYRGRIPIWDVINEAHHLTDGGRHPQGANVLDLTREQLVELTALAAAETRAADPAAVRVVNCNDPFRASRARIARPEAETTDAESYLRDLLARGVEFEVIGLQWYTGAMRQFCRDMLTVAEQLERYCAIARAAGKPVHITEVQVPSDDRPDPSSSVHRRAAAAGQSISPSSDTAGWWHRSWDEETQADWVAAFYTLCFAQPEVEAVTWWDFADPGFWPWGGMLAHDERPKPIYHRLLDLAARLRGGLHLG